MTIAAEIIHGDLPLVTGDTETAGRNGELDTLTVEAVVEYPAWQASAQDLGYVRNEKITGYHAMFVEDMARGSRSGEACEVTINCLGLLEPGEKRRRTLGVAGQQIAIGPFEKVILAWEEAEEGEDPEGGGGSAPVLVKRRVPKLDSEGEVEYKIIATPTGTAERWNVRQAIVTVTDTYFSTSEPSMVGAGEAAVPPNAPSVPGSPWDDGYDQPLRFNHPNGWVLDDRQVEEIFNNSTGGLWAITDTYGFYLTAVPD